MQTPDVTGAAGPTIVQTPAKGGADTKTGLTEAEVQTRLKTYGPNALVEKQKSTLAALVGYFCGPIPWMIGAAALMAFVVGDWGDFVILDKAGVTEASLPVTKKTGTHAIWGCFVKQGEMTAVVTATGANTFFGRPAKLVAGAGSVSHFQRAVMRIGNFPIILALVLVVILVAARLFDIRGHYDRAVLLRLAEIVLILLVASVPVAMPAVLSVTMALGARMLAKRKAIVSRLEAIEELAGLDVLCSDKTGTLTENKLTLGEPQPWPGTDSDTLILMASLASRAADNDPIDLAILAGLKDPSVLKSYQQEKYVPFDPVDKRTEATIKDASSKVFRVSKGAPQVILGLAKLSGTDLEKAQQTVNNLASHGYRTIGVAVAHD